MAEVITISNQKGGTGKSTTTGAMAYILAEELGYKTLVIDFDPQGNETELLTGRDTEEFEDNTILNAMHDGDPRDYILAITDNLFLIPADEHLGVFPRYLCGNYYLEDENGNVLRDEYGTIQFSPEGHLILKNTLDKVKDYFDFVLIDTPPMLSDFHGNALAASDSCIIVYQTGKFGFKAVRKFLETIKASQEGSNPNLKLRGILPTMAHTQRSESKAYTHLGKEQYKDIMFDTVIKNTANISQLAIYGFDPKENKGLNKALEQYREVTTEVLRRIKNDIYFEVTEELIGRGE
ncbi:ParA family protein [Laceyella sacchari]|uniref:ParA family protein n=1 Tax=Laceyella sacchari TaxID=37482 RepID=A0ABY5U6Q7_LACSH|nr:ParA family protein [Laceyella sacchari]UWE05321.1 ParA family protein [Laceyella sacchari]